MCIEKTLVLQFCSCHESHQCHQDNQVFFHTHAGESFIIIKYCVFFETVKNWFHVWYFTKTDNWQVMSGIKIGSRRSVIFVIFKSFRRFYTLKSSVSDFLMPFSYSFSFSCPYTFRLFNPAIGWFFANLSCSGCWVMGMKMIMVMINIWDRGLSS